MKRSFQSEAELLGLAEAAELLGLSKPAAARRRKAADFPEPVTELACGPVWTRDQIVGYAVERSANFHERESVEEVAVPDRIGPATLARLIGRSEAWIESRKFTLPCVRS